MPSDAAGRTTFVRFLSVIGVVQIALGIAQLVCGGMAVKYTKGQTDTFGPPYFTGAFIAGCLITIAGVISLVSSRRAGTLDTTNQAEVQDISCLLCGELGLCVATCMGCFIGLFFVAIFGLRDCDPHSFGNFCNYTDNMSQNKTVALFILLFILASAVICVTTICCSCRFGSNLGINFNRRRRPLVIVGGMQGPITTYQTNSTPIVTETGYQYSPVVIGGVTPNTVNQPSNYSASGQYQPQVTNPAIRELQEQNRLLQEQIRLQQEQLSLQQRLHQHAGQAPAITTPTQRPPPPSYEHCTSDESTIRQLEEYNRELQRHCQEQQYVLEKQLPPMGP